MMKKLCAMAIALLLTTGLVMGAGAEAMTDGAADTAVVVETVFDEVPEVTEPESTEDEDTQDVTFEEVPEVVIIETLVVETANEEETVDAVVENVATEEEEVVFAEATSYEIKYLYHDGVEDKELIVNVPETETIEAPEVEPVMEGHAFRFWYDERLAEEDVVEIVAFEFGLTPDENLVLIPHFEAIPVVVENVEDVTDVEDMNDDLVVLDDETVLPVVLDDTVENDEIETENQETPVVLADFITIIDDPEEETEEESSEESDLVANDAVVIIEEEDEGGIVILDEDDEEEEEEALVVTSMEDDVLPLAGPATLPVDGQILLSSNHGDCMNEGDMIVVRATLVGYEGLNVSTQWQFNDGTGWQDAVGETGLEYSFSATSESVNYGVRLGVTVNGAN